MAKSENQKLKLIYLMRIFLERTDENHHITMQEIISELLKYDIKAERKSIYDDIEALNRAGMDIVGVQRKGRYDYYVAGREFELAELKLLVDTVQASKFITPKKSEQLIKKLESLVSKYEASQLERQVYVASRIKTMNESIYYNVDKIHSAINSNLSINFKYYEWTVEKKLELKKNGDKKNISPWALACDNANYYLVGYDSTAGRIKHYRVDKMRSIELTDNARDGKEYFEKFDIGAYTNKVFGMFGGNQEHVVMEFKNNLIGVVIDRFGKDVMVVPKNNNKFRVNVDVEVSNMFLAWIFGLGDGVQIISPKSVVKQMKHEAKRLMEQYR